MQNTRFYRIWIEIKRRVDDKKRRNYADYGGRGIKYLWTSFEEFRNDMYESYLAHVSEYGEKNTSIDRIDNDGNYCKENCRWATEYEQTRNRSITVFVEKGGIEKTAMEWAKQYDIPYRIFWQRLKRGKISAFSPYEPRRKHLV